MSKSSKNYFDEIKKRKIGDNFLEHISRLIFFAILLTIEGIFKKLNEIRFRISNFMSGRGFRHIFSRYSEYKNSVQHLIEKPFYKGSIRTHLAEVKNRVFSDRDRAVIFGIRESTHSLVAKSKNAFNRITGYTIRVGNKYFQASPIISFSRNYTANMITFFLKKDSISDPELHDPFYIKHNREYLKKITEGYKIFMHHALGKFYSSDFRTSVQKKAGELKTVRNNLDKLLKSMERLEKKQPGRFIEHSSG